MSDTASLIAEALTDVAAALCFEAATKSQGMILLRQPVKYRAWWDTRFSRRWQVTGQLVRMWGSLFAPIPHEIPANDRDHIKW